MTYTQQKQRAARNDLLAQLCIGATLTIIMVTAIAHYVITITRL